MTAKEMLAAVLQRGVLTERERESFTDMWDRIHRFNRCSDKQRAWVEKVYFAQKLDREEASAKRRVVIPTWQKEEPQTLRAQAPVSPMQPVTARSEGSMGAGLIKTNARQILQRRQSGTFRITPPAQEQQKVGYINYPGIQREALVTSLVALEAICPRIEPGSKQYQTIAGFFAKGGLVLKIKPLEAQVA
jgi:hypothetical protein